MLTLPKLTQTLFAYLKDSTWRLHDEATQIAKARKLAVVVLKEDRGTTADPNTSIATFKSKWLTFHENSKADRKTRIFRVYNIAPGELLGEVKWSGPFKSYGFFPAPGCGFSGTDMADLQEFIELLMAEREIVQERARVEKDVLK